MNKNINTKLRDYHRLIVLILQITALTNAVLLGWKVKKVEGNKFIICKKLNELTELDNNTIKFLDTIMQFKEIDC